MKMTLRRPCAKCPFRTDVEPFLTKQRAHQILQGLTVEQGTFTCHETTVEGDDDEDDCATMVDGPNAQHCAGALILLERMDRPNQLMRIYERFGGYDRTLLDMDSPVFDTPHAMVRAQPA